MKFERSCSLSRGIFREHAGLATVVGLLMIFSATTEGVGLILVVPMLSALQNRGTADVGILRQGLAMAGIPVALGPMLALFVALVAARAVLGYARTIAALRLQVNIVDGLRRRALAALLRCDWRVLSTMRNSDAVIQLLANTDRIAWGLDQGVRAVATGITLGAIGLAALILSPGMTAGGIAGGGLVLFAFKRMRLRASLLGAQLNRDYINVYGELSEALGALRVIKTLGGERKAEKSFDAKLTSLRNVEFAFKRGVGWGQIALQSSGALLLAVLVELAVEQWHAGPSVILPMVALFARTLPLLGDMQDAAQDWTHARPALVATLALIEKAESVPDAEHAAAEVPVLRGSIRLEHVGVAYAGQPRAALSGIDLTIPAGSIVALTGQSGAGKSTLADLLGGIISADTGRISIDGRLLEGGARRAWRLQVAYVQQDPVLFSASIRDNLLWAAPNSSDEQLWQALADAAALFVREMPHGLDTVLGESGRRLSGGERQRIVLARSLLGSPALLILDESTSAIDPASEAAIILALQRLKRRLTIVVICHRGGLAEIADRVVVLEKGHVVSDTVPKLRARHAKASAQLE